MILLRDKETPNLRVTGALEMMLEGHYELNKINLCYYKYGLFDEKYQPENENGIDRTEDIRGQFLEFETDLNKYLNNHPQKNETILLSMLVNFELKDLNGKYYSSGEIRNRNEFPQCLFSHVKYFLNNLDNSPEYDLMYLLPTINTFLNFANSFRSTSDGGITYNPNSYTQPPITDKSDDFFDLLFNLPVFDCDIEKVDNFVDILKVKTGNQNCSECDINYEIFMKIKRFLSIQLLYYHRKKLDLDKYISTYKYLEKNGVKINNTENDFLLYELESKYRDKDLTPEEETFCFGIKQAGTWN